MNGTNRRNLTILVGIIVVFHLCSGFVGGDSLFSSSDIGCSADSVEPGGCGGSSAPSCASYEGFPTTACDRVKACGLRGAQAGVLERVLCDGAEDGCVRTDDTYRRCVERVVASRAPTCAAIEGALAGSGVAYIALNEDLRRCAADAETLSAYCAEHPRPQCNVEDAPRLQLPRTPCTCIERRDWLQPNVCRGRNEPIKWGCKEAPDTWFPVGRELSRDVGKYSTIVDVEELPDSFRLRSPACIAATIDPVTTCAQPETTERRDLRSSGGPITQCAPVACPTPKQ